TGALSGTGDLADVWTWDGSGWVRIGTTEPRPGGRSYGGLAYDEKSGRTVAFGGTSTLGNPLVDTWLLRFHGAQCSADGDCDTGHCVDGACCETARCGVCQACNTPASPGTCAPVLGKTDPDSCSGAVTCDSTGACLTALGRGCNGP